MLFFLGFFVAFPLVMALLVWMFDHMPMLLFICFCSVLVFLPDVVYWLQRQ